MPIQKDKTAAMQAEIDKLTAFREQATGLLKYAALVFEQVKPIHEQIAAEPESYGEEPAKLSGMFVTWHAHYMEACANLLRE